MDARSTHDRRVALEHGSDVLCVGAVEREAAREEGGVGGQAAGLVQRSARPDPHSLSLFARCRHPPVAARAAAEHDGAIDQRRIEQPLHGDEEGVEIETADPRCRREGGHASSSWTEQAYSILDRQARRK